MKGFSFLGKTHLPIQKFLQHHGLLRLLTTLSKFSEKSTPFKQLLLTGSEHFVFPRLCLSCKENIPNNFQILCPSCFQELELLDPELYCPFCFSELDGKRCLHCINKDLTTDYVASCFDYFGAAKDLILACKWHEQPYLTKGLASFMYLQYCRLKWPKPDFITYVPQTPFRYIQRGYNQSFLLAKELSCLINAPLFCSIKKVRTTLPQAQLDLKERKQLGYDLFSIRNGTIIEDKRVLIIDDVYTTGTTTECVAQALQHHHPRRIYVLTVCRS